jgi:hypothetical protein
VYDLRLTDEQFYELTHRQFHHLCLRHKEANERAELLMGINTSALVNSSMNPPKKGSCPADYMPSAWQKRQEKAVKPKRFSRKKFADDLRNMMRSMAGMPGSNVVIVDPNKK